MEKIHQHRPWLTPLVLALLTVVFFRGYALLDQPAWGLLAMAHLWWGAWGMARLAKGFGASALGGLLAGIMFGFSSYLVANLWAGNFALVVASSWGLWGTVIVHRIAANHSAALVALVATGVVLTFLPLAPTPGNDEMSPENNVSPPAQWVTVVIPDLLGEPTLPDVGYWGGEDYAAASGFAGTWALVAAALAWRLRLPEGRTFGAAGGIGLTSGILWTSLGPSRAPGGSLYLVVAGLAGVAGLVLTQLQRTTSEERRDWLRPALRTWIPVAATLVFAFTLALVALWTLAPPDRPYWRWWHAANALGESGLLLLGVGLSLRLWGQDGPQADTWAALVTFAVVLIDLWRVGLRLFI